MKNWIEWIMLSILTCLEKDIVTERERGRESYIYKAIVDM